MGAEATVEADGTGAKPAKVGVSAALKAAAKVCYLENAAMNAHKRVHDAMRKELFVAMVEGGVSEFRCQVTDETGQKVSLAVEVATPLATVMDVAKLRTLVNPETLALILTATKAAVETHAGKDIAALCELKVRGTRNVFVTKAPAK